MKYGIIIDVVNNGMSPSGKAPDFDSGIRRFKSGHPSQHKGDAFASPLCWLGSVFVEHLRLRKCVGAHSPLGDRGARSLGSERANLRA